MANNRTISTANTRTNVPRLTDDAMQTHDDATASPTVVATAPRLNSLLNRVLWTFAAILGFGIVVVMLEGYITRLLDSSRFPEVFAGKKYAQGNATRINLMTVAPEVNITSAATFVITCGTQETDAIEEMRPLLSSLLLLASRPIRLVFLTDGPGVERIKKMFGDELERAKQQLWVDIFHIDNKMIEKWTAAIRFDPYAHHSGRWGAAKLMVPWVLRNTQQAVVLDTDMVLVDDPIRLWGMFDSGCADSKWVYKMPLFTRKTPSEICSCVVLINLEHARKLQVYPQLFRNALETAKGWYNEKKSLWQPAHGDQGLYWLLMRLHPSMFCSLPERWNSDHCHRYYGAFNQGSNRTVSILHRNCAGTNATKTVDRANPFFDFYINYKWHWLRAEDGNKIQIRTFRPNDTVLAEP